MPYLCLSVLLLLMCLPVHRAKDVPATAKDALLLAAIREPSLPTLHPAPNDHPASTAPATHLMVTRDEGGTEGPAPPDPNLLVAKEQLERLQTLIRLPSLPTMYNPQLHSGMQPRSDAGVPSTEFDAPTSVEKQRVAILHVLGPLILALVGTLGLAAVFNPRRPTIPAAAYHRIPVEDTPAA
eukprot:GGOE01014215.1.p2 GENE.GGOE01014215.1~~GGOE01014215.1.p2  ORF type:complete len:191 (-),score=44.74 GGOE01014215.1:226-771(-)